MVADSTGLVRGMHRWDLVALAINLIIGAGIFGLPSRIFALAGPWSVLVVGGCALLSGLVVLCFAEVASRFDRTGGPYLYAREAFGDFAGFEMGWLFWLRSTTTFGAVCNLLLTYLGVLWPAAAGPLRPWLSIAIAIGITAVVVRGVRESATVGNVLTVAKLAPLLAFVGMGVFFVAPHRLALGTWPGTSAFTSAVLPLVFAFAGFDALVITSGEMRDPRRDLPFALFVSLAVVAVLYTLIQVVCVGTLPVLATSERPLADAARLFLGPAAAGLIAIGAVISSLGALLATVLTAPRLPFALADAGKLPRALGATHPRYHTPHVAIVLTTAGMLAVTLTGSFVYAVTINAMIRLLIYVTTCLALILLRRRPGAPPAGYRAPAGNFVASAAILLCLGILSRSTTREVRDVAIAAGAGVLVYATRWVALRRSGDVHA